MAFTVAVPETFALDKVARSHGWYDLPPFAWDAAAGESCAVGVDCRPLREPETPGHLLHRSARQRA